jgi:MoxR-like ATPase
MTNPEYPVAANANQILGQIRKAVLGKDNVLIWVLAAILAKGHILLEDIPGVGKTTMALAFSKTLGLDYSRMQFTPDVLPSDVTGYTVLDPKTLESSFRPGAVLCNLFLADELNRATSRTQSALLEAMEEGQVTVDGVSHKVPQPFAVIATQNPTGAAGTQLLPDSQMDRFMVRLSLGYPSPTDEIAMIVSRKAGNPLHTMEPLITKEALIAMQEAVENTHVNDDIMKYTVELICATRNHPSISQGASPRATLAVIALSKAVAQLRGRDYVLPDDVRSVFLRAIPHRLRLSDEAVLQKQTEESILQSILSAVKSPAVI